MDHYSWYRQTKFHVCGVNKRAHEPRCIDQKSYQNSNMDVWGSHTTNMQYNCTKNKGQRLVLRKRFLKKGKLFTRE